jgi:sigma-B regulation protein RsbQ
VLQCTQGVIAAPEVGAFVHAHVPDSVLVTLNATGHCPQLSAPVETAEQIIAFGTSE